MKKIIKNKSFFNRIKRSFIDYKDEIAFSSYGKGTIKKSNIFKDKLFYKALFVFAFTIYILSNTFSWFYHEYVSKGTVLSVGRISQEINQYSRDGELLTEVTGTENIIYEGNMSTITRDTAYISIENTGTLDLEYKIVFQLDGTIASTGVMYYRLYDITNEVNNSSISNTYNTKLKSYAANNPPASNMEYDTANPVSNLSTISNSITTGTIELSEDAEANIRYYRMDYGMYSTANSSLYSESTVNVHYNVYTSQVGADSISDTEGDIWEVENEQQFRNAVINATSGDTIKLLNDISIDGSIDFNRRINIDVNTYKLSVAGNLTYDFVELGELNIKTTGTGSIDIENDFYVNAPKSEIHIVGSNDAYDIYAGGDITFNGLQNEEDDGVLLETVRIIKNKVGNIPADIILRSNTRLNIGPEVYLGYVAAESGSTNIEIINNGNVIQIKLDEMALIDTFTKAQIYVYNLGVIQGVLGLSAVTLPSNSTPWLGVNNGNTLIVKGVTSSDVTVTGSENFNQTDINYADITDNVVPVSGEKDAYVVYIRESADTVEELLTSYFTQHGYSSPSLEIAKIEKLIIYTVNAQYLENEDFDFLKSDKVPVLKYLDISSSRVMDNTIANRIKSGALENKTSITKLYLPKTLVSIGSNAFYGLSLGVISTSNVSDFDFLTIPSTVTSIETGAFYGAKYVKFEGDIPPVIEQDAFIEGINGARYFVPKAAIDDYQNTSNINSIYVHQTAFLSDNTNYFVYSTKDGVGISMFVPTTNVGGTLSIPNTILIGGYQFSITDIGTGAFAHITTPSTGTSLTIPSAVTSIGDYAFYNKAILSMNFANVTSVGDYAFYNSKFDSITADNITTIGDYAFYNSTVTYAHFNSLISMGESAMENSESLFEINLGAVSSLAKRALYNCPQLGKVYFSNIDTKTLYNKEVINLTLGEDAVFARWGTYLDGRLRVYVPDGTTESGTQYIKLYNDLFGSNTEYVYVTGTMIGNYQHYAIPYDWGEYTVKIVSKYDTTGLKLGAEIIEYHGADLTSDYQIPSTVTIGDMILDVISIGDSAYRHVSTSGSVNILNNNILNVGAYSFYGLDLNSIEANSLANIGDYAFGNTGLTKANFPALVTLGNYALSNMETLYSVNLGSVMNIGENAISNNPNLEQLFISTIDINNMVIAGSPFDNIGTNAKSRMRIYVPDGEEYVTFYKKLLGFEEYIYPTGTIIGSYINYPIPYDIGEYSVRKVSYTNFEGTLVPGFEIIEYHGSDLDSTYTIPEELTVNGETLPVISIGKNAYIHVASISSSNISISNESLINISSGAFKGVNITSFTATNLLTLNSYAFNESSLNKFVAKNLSYIGSYALANTNTLYMIDLGLVKTMDENSLYNLPNLSQVFFKTTDTKLMFNENAITDVGANTNNRIRFYVNDTGVDELEISVNAVSSGGWQSGAGYVYQYNVTVTNTSGKDINGWKFFLNSSSDNASIVNIWGAATTSTIEDIIMFNNVDYTTSVADGGSITFGVQISTATQNYVPSFYGAVGLYEREGTVSKPNYVDIYKSLFNETYRNYFYAKGEIVGSYSQPNIPYDIGEYMVRKVTYNDFSNAKIQGWELVEYHGDDIMSDYLLPESLTIDNMRYDVIGIGDYAYRFATISSKDTGTFDLTNSKLKYIGEHAFDGVGCLRNINASSVETIGDYAFNDNALYMVNVANVTSIGAYAFANNPTLNYANVGTATIFGNGVFYNDTGLEQLYFNSIDANTESGIMNIQIGENVFYNTGTDVGSRFRIYVPDSEADTDVTYLSLYKNTLPEEVTKNIFPTGTIIGSYKYGSYPYDIGEYSVRKVTINNVIGEAITGYEIVEYHGSNISSSFLVPTTLNVQGESLPVISIGDYAYNYVESSSTNWKLNLSSNIVSIGDYAFAGRDVTEVTGSYLSYIGSYAFAECQKLTTVEFEGVVYVSDYAFYMNPVMANVTLGNYVTYIGDYALYYVYTPAVRNLYLDVETPPLTGTNPFPAYTTGTVGIWFRETYYTYSFWIYVSATSVNTYQRTYPYSDYARSQVSYGYGSGNHVVAYSATGDYIYNIVNDSEIEIISYRGSATGDLIIPETIEVGSEFYPVTSILSTAFSSSYNITSITLPTYVNNVSTDFLNGNDSIANIYVNENNMTFSSNNGVLYNKDSSILIKYPPAKTDTEFSLGSGVSVIASNAFSNNKNLTSAIFDDDLVVISQDAFTNCTSLERVEFNNESVPYITGFNVFDANREISIIVPSASLNSYQNNIFLKKYTFETK